VRKKTQILGRPSARTTGTGGAGGKTGLGTSKLVGKKGAWADAAVSTTTVQKEY